MYCDHPGKKITVSRLVGVFAHLRKLLTKFGIFPASFWILILFSVFIGTSQLIRLQYLNDDRKLKRRRKSMDHPISRSVLEKARCSTRID